MQLLMQAILQYPRTLLLCFLSPAKLVVEQNLYRSELCLGGRTKYSFCIVVDLEPGLLVIIKTVIKKKKEEIWKCCSSGY